jgi:hypothetical protein
VRLLQAKYQVEERFLFQVLEKSIVERVLPEWLETLQLASKCIKMQTKLLK